jgi:hypothetical protein
MKALVSATTMMEKGLRQFEPSGINDFQTVVGAAKPV